jgi:hypothetical protein
MLIVLVKVHEVILIKLNNSIRKNIAKENAPAYFGAVSAMKEK